MAFHGGSFCAGAKNRGTLEGGSCRSGDRDRKRPGRKAGGGTAHLLELRDDSAGGYAFLHELRASHFILKEDKTPTSIGGEL